MALSAQQLNMRLGSSTGSTSECQHCGGTLLVQEGTDVSDMDQLGGFRETYECLSCGREGTYKHRWDDHKEAYMGACSEGYE